jgi:23S rRNA (cytosine1962-C5)-methyltransferase
LAEATTALRRFDGRWEGAPGWTVDQFDDVAVVRRFGDEGSMEEWLEATLSLGARTAYGMHRNEVLGPAGEDRSSEIVVVEDGLRFEVDVLRGRNVGLFPDARPMRRWVRSRSTGLRVLNLFSYTSAFGVHAAAGGARSVTNVDVVPSALERGVRNFRLNDLPVDSRTHMRSDAFEFLKRAGREGRTWDLVVVDPPPVPTVGRGRKGKGRGRFDPRKDWPRLARAASAVCAEGGSVVLLSAARGASGFEELVTDMIPGIPLRIDRGEDYPGPRDQGLRALAWARGET